MAQIIITRSADGLNAFCKVTDSAPVGVYPSGAALLTALKDQKIVYGVDPAALRKMVAGRIYNTLVEVARGLAVRESVNASLELLIDISASGKPRILQDGHVDFHDLQTVKNVSKATPLIRRTPAVPGKDGVSVFGTPLKAPLPRECALLPGRGTQISPDDPDLLIAAIDGALSVNPNGFVEIRTEKLIPGDIDFSTGDISFNGDLKIAGTVRAGFKISAEGNIVILGVIEDAEVSCGGNLEIHGGAVGSSNGKLISQGTIKVRHIENFSAEARHDIIIAEDAIHSHLNAGRNISVKSILGGYVSAGGTIMAQVIGGAAEIHTVVDIGRIYKLMQNSEALKRERSALENESGSTNDVVFELVSKEMDQAGFLGAAALARLNSFKLIKKNARERLAVISLQKQEIEKELKQQANPVVKAKTVYRGTVVTLGQAAKAIEETMTNVVITAEDSLIIIR